MTSHHPYKKQVQHKTLKRKHVNKTSSDCEMSEDKICPPSQVSKWTWTEMEHFHIHYEDNPVHDPLELLKKVGINSNIQHEKSEKVLDCDESKVKSDHGLAEDMLRKPSDDILEYTKNLPSFDFDKFEIDISEIKQTNSEKIIERIRYIDNIQQSYSIETMKNSPCNLTLKNLEIKHPGFANIVLNSISSVPVILDQLKFILYLILRGEVIQEMAYRDLFSRFTEYCMMTPQSGDTIARLLPVRIKNKVCAITSRPDIRYVKKIQASTCRGQIEDVLIVSVAKVKSDVIYRSCTRTQSTSGTTRCDDDSSEKFDINCLDSSVLAQHAGELMVEWKYSAFKPYVLGVIVVETKVILTCLFMSYDHISKIQMGDSFKEKATISYSHPLDYTSHEERKVLFDVLMRIGLTQLE